MEQNVDIEVPRHRRHQGGLQDSHPGQGSTGRVLEQINDTRIRGGLQGFHPGQGVLQRSVE